LLRCWGLCCLGCVIGMMSLVEATSMSRRTRMAPRCMGPENFRGAMIIGAPSMFHSRQSRLTRADARLRANPRGRDRAMEAWYHPSIA
jgi:hypothetical protein